MVRRRSTVRFRKGAPGQALNSTHSELVVGPKVGPTSSCSGRVPGQRRPLLGACVSRSPEMSRAVWVSSIKLGSLASDAPSERPEKLSYAQAHQPRVSELFQFAQA